MVQMTLPRGSSDHLLMCEKVEKTPFFVFSINQTVTRNANDKAARQQLGLSEGCESLNQKIIIISLSSKVLWQKFLVPRAKGHHRVESTGIYPG